MKANFCHVVAHSLELDSNLAVIELIEKCELQLGSNLPQAGILYAGIDVNHQLVVDKLLSKWPDLHLIGSTTDGELSSESGYQEDSLVLTLFFSDQIKIVSGCIENTSADMNIECSEAFINASSRLGGEPVLCIMISDVMKINGEAVMEQFTLASKGKLPIVGGLSSDSWRFDEAKQIYNKTVSSDISSFLLFSGPLNFSFGVDSGWEPIGDVGTITKAKGNVIYEINHKPALEFYRDVLGESGKPTLELPIAVYNENGCYQYLRTTIENYDKITGSVTYLGNVPINYKVCLTIANREAILSGAASAIKKAIRSFPSGNSPSIALCFSCSARRVLLGTRTKEEYRIVYEEIGDNVQMSGFYTYGEFCPKPDKQLNGLHNETFVAVLLG